MKKIILLIILTVIIIFLNIGCSSYQAAIAIEPREKGNAIGAAFTLDSRYIGSSFFYLPDMNPKINGPKTQSIGYDFCLKYPFYIKPIRVSLSPMAVFESRYLFTGSVQPEITEKFGFGVKLGGGLGIYLGSVVSFYGNVLYQPKAITFMNSYPGFRYCAGLGFHLKNNTIKNRIEDKKAQKEKLKMEREKVLEEEAKKQVKVQKEQERERAIYQAVVDDPNSPQAHYDMAVYLRSKGKNILAIESLEKTLELDPNFRYAVTEELHYTPNAAAFFGIQTTENFKFGNYSLNFFVAALHFDSANGTGSDTDKFVVAAEKQNTLEKALSAFRKGYEIDITEGKNNSRNLKAAYLGTIAKTLDLLGRKEAASLTYVELSKTINITPDLVFRVASTSREGPSYYVSAKGSNNNEGLSEDKPLRSLALAYEKATMGDVRRITVIGTLSQQSEAGTNESYVFYLRLPENIKGDNEILITGKWGSSPAVLSGTGSGKNTASILGKVRFEYIGITGGDFSQENKNGDGLHIFGTAIIDSGTVINSNKSHGVYVNSVGTCIFSGGEIRGNKGAGIKVFGECTIAGGEIRDNENSGVDISFFGKLNMQGGTITNNKSSKNGAGVSSGGTFTMSGGTITSNKATENGGGVYVSAFGSEGEFTMLGGSITYNTSRNGGGVYVSIMGSEFTMRGGSIGNNTSMHSGGGVYVSGVKEELIDIDGGIFRQTSGSIINNKARAVGGVYVGFNSRYEKTGGTVNNNTAAQYYVNQLPGSTTNIARMPGSRGSGW